MAKIKKMGEGIVVKDAPHHRTTIDGVMAKGKRTTTNGKTLLVVSICILQCKRYAKKKKKSHSHCCSVVVCCLFQRDMLT